MRNRTECLRIIFDVSIGSTTLRPGPLPTNRDAFQGVVFTTGRHPTSFADVEQREISDWRAMAPKESLPDHVCSLVRQGVVGEPFSVRDIRPHLASRFSVNYITTSLKNYSISPDGSAAGDYVRCGRQARFVRLGRGRYEVIRKAA